MPTRGFAAKEGWERAPVEEPQYGGAGPTPEGLSSQDLLVRQADLLAAILQELREQVQQGYVYPATLLVTSTTVPQEVTFDPALFSISLTNDGPNIVDYRIPNRSSAQWVQLRPGEVIAFNFIKGLVASAAFLLVAAGTATIRIEGTY